MNDFAGVYGVPDPAAALRRLGVEPVWSCEQVAFGGAPVWNGPLGKMVVSGELILDNAQQLRSELEMPDAPSGVLLAALYERGGVAALERAVGMFAVALWDADASRLILHRDGCGARTLYLAHQGSATWFAARLKTLRRSPAVSRELSMPALAAYLCLAYVPEALTMWRDVTELRPGAALSLPDGQTFDIWSPRPTTGEPVPLEEATHHLRGVLEEAVQCGIPPSGPVAVYLSGGLDSSLVAAMAARMAPGRVTTWSISFGEEYLNELEWSSMVARHCGVPHQVLTLPPARIRAELPATMGALDDPIGDPLTVPNYALGLEASRTARVVLNGEGGDPCFGGPKNSPMLLHALYPSAESREAAYFRAHLKCYDDLPELLSPEAQAGLRKEAPIEDLVRPYLADAPPEDWPLFPAYLDRLMHANVRLKGAGHILTKVNNLTAHFGLAGHSPLFDRRVVEASFAIPPEYKLEGAVEKAILKRAVANLLPPEILQRPKSGMLVPVQAWFRRDLRRYAAGLLLGRGARTRPYLNQRLVRDWLEYRGNLWPRHGVKLWLLLSLELWLRAQED